jgi:hypothetical protein
MISKELYIRFTETIEADIERGTSILTESDNEIVDGLCAFPGKDTIEATIKKAKRLGKSVANPGDTFVIVMAKHNINANPGTLGVIITDLEIVEKGIVD